MPDISAETILPIILNHLIVGSIIYTDGCRAFSKFSNDQYSQYTVIHQYNWIDLETSAYTNTIEMTWPGIKAKY